MGRISGVISAIVLSVLVGGCTIPVSVTVASWALDGVSYLATNKSITDHGISFIAGQDCAMHRIVTEMDFNALCHKYQDPEPTNTAVADASDVFKKQKTTEPVPGFDLALITEQTGPAERSLVLVSRQGDAKNSLGEPSIEEIANFETASGGPDPEELDQSDFEKLDDPEERKGFNIKGIWSFLVSLTS
jgi:hypothetical protein